ncbi:MAG: FAD binding domain-containing protein [Myxococcales bacterium]|nr:FAD binding domain-containing protein [Myxococcales bacterium]
MTAIAHSAVSVHRARTLQDALDQLSQAPLQLLAGGTDIMVEANHGGLRGRHFLDISGLGSELGGHSWLPDGALRIGALCTYAQLQADARAQAELPMLMAASRLVGATQIQSRGTYAGNVENGSPAADAAPALLALDAVVELRSLAGTRTVPLAHYYTGYRSTARRSDELISALIVPKPDGGVSCQFFRKVGTRAFQAITKVGLSARIVWQGGQITDARIVATSMAATICRAHHIENALRGLSDIDAAAKSALRRAQDADLRPMDDVRSSADYRAEVFHRLVLQAASETRPS